MNKETREQLTKKNSLLVREYNKHFERKIMLEIELSLQRKLDPEEVSAKKPLRVSSDGHVMSHQEIKRKEHIMLLDEELEKVTMILGTISELFEE
jgi:hypothetical protein